MHGNQHADEAAFAELFAQYKNLVYRTAYLMLGDAAEAEEALQEVFVLVFKSLPQFDPAKGAMTTWLHRITTNYCLGCRRKRRVSCRPLAEAPQGLLSQPAEAGLATSPEKEAMWQAIDRLSEKQRAVIVLRYYWDLSYAEIAQILEIPLGTVKSRLDLALKTLKVNLADQEEAPNSGQPRNRRLAHEM